MKQFFLIATGVLASCLYLNMGVAAKPPQSEQISPTEEIIIAGFPSPYDESEINPEVLIWKPVGEGPFPVVIMLHGSGGLYYQTDAQCDDDDRTCWGLSGKFKYWGKQLSLGNHFGFQTRYMVVAVDSYTPRGYDHFGVVNINAIDRPLNVSSYLGRPWDLYAVLRYLKSRADVKSDAIFALGFSDGGGAVLSSVAASDNAALIGESDWFEGIDNHTAEGHLAMQAIGLQAAVAYYPSCGFFGYFDGIYSNYAPVLIQTGQLDVTTPIAACLERQTEAWNLGTAEEDFQVMAYDNMQHGFDYEQYDTEEACFAAEKTLAFFSKSLGDYLFKSNFEISYCSQ